MNFELLKEKLRAFHDSEEGKESIKKFHKGLEIRSNREDQMWNFLESLSTEEYESLLEKFIKWEEKFEDREYDKGKIKSSNVFNTIFGAIKQNAESYEEDSMFFGGGSTYRGYQWLVYVGQGSFYTIEKNGERIFTSS